jgi:hypothetical protein
MSDANKTVAVAFYKQALMPSSRSLAGRCRQSWYARAVAAGMSSPIPFC